MERGKIVQRGTHDEMKDVDGPVQAPRRPPVTAATRCLLPQSAPSSCASSPRSRSSRATRSASTPPVTVGRERTAGLWLDDRSVSRQHAQLEPTADGVRVRDLGCGNGVWMGAERISDRQVAPGQQFRDRRHRLRGALGSGRGAVAGAGRADRARRVAAARAAAAAAGGLVAFRVVEGSATVPVGHDPTPCPASWRRSAARRPATSSSARRTSRAGTPASSARPRACASSTSTAPAASGWAREAVKNRVLQPGDRVRLGRAIVLEVVADGAGAAPPAAPPQRRSAAAAAGAGRAAVRAAAAAAARASRLRRLAAGSGAAGRPPCAPPVAPPAAPPALAAPAAPPPAPSPPPLARPGVRRAPPRRHRPPAATGPPPPPADPPSAVTKPHAVAPPAPRQAAGRTGTAASAQAAGAGPPPPARRPSRRRRLAPPDAAEPDATQFIVAQGHTPAPIRTEQMRRVGRARRRHRGHAMLSREALGDAARVGGTGFFRRPDAPSSASTRSGTRS